jgi:hypothetical protein
MLPPPAPRNRSSARMPRACRAHATHPSSRLRLVCCAPRPRLRPLCSRTQELNHIRAAGPNGASQTTVIVTAPQPQMMMPAPQPGMAPQMGGYPPQGYAPQPGYAPQQPGGYQ